jgi:predicted ATPase/DNA-binding CsgD family transcriptional regulator
LPRSDLHESSESPVISILTNYLKAKNLLLVLDNCEHLIAACAQLSDTLLRACPNLYILATSRETLGIAGEVAFRVPSLSLPDPKNLPPLESLAHYESMRLFVDRAIAARTDFQLTSQNASSIAQICQQLDGMPLAIELAAARVKMLSAEQIAARLDDRFQFLTGGSRTAPSRQQTLRAILDWSYDLLPGPERALFRRMAVFTGGFALEAAEAICAGEGIDTAQVFDLLSNLVDKSLVIRGEEQEAQARYRMLETIREYGCVKLEEIGEARWVWNRQLDFFLHLAEKAEPHLVGPDPLKWLQRLDIEYGNLRLALRTASDTKAIEKGLRLVCALGQYWQARGYFSECRERSADFLSLRDEMDTSTKLIRVKVLYQAGWLAVLQSDYATGESLLQECIALGQQLGDDNGIALALNGLCFSALNLGNFELASSIIDKALAISQTRGDKRTRAKNLATQGFVMREQGDLTTARSLLEEALALRRAVGNKRAIASSLNDIGATAHAQGDPIAESLLESSLKMFQELSDQFGISRCLHDLGAVVLGGGNASRAHSLFSQGLTIFRDQGDKRNAIKCLEGLAGTALVFHQFERAARLFGAAEAQREMIRVPLPGSHRANHDRTVANLRAQVDATQLAAMWAEGRAMTLDQTIEYALQSDPASELSATMPPSKYPAGLTEREVEVLRWLARGLSNQEIADKLVLSKRTVHAHLRSIYSKLDVTTRSAATRVANEHKIV